MIIKKVAADIGNDFKKASSAEAKRSIERFFSEKIKCHGVKSAGAAKIARKYLPQIKSLEKKQIFALCEELFKSGYCEESLLAGRWAARIHKDFLPGDFKFFENWVKKYIDNWAECDTFCNHAVGSFIIRYPEYIGRLKKWTKSRNRWVRRAAAVSLVVPARRGMFLRDVFEIADSLLSDKDDMVQKGYGWMLKEASRLHTEEVFKFVSAHKDKMPRTALRYAIELMPKELRKKAMARPS